MDHEQRAALPPAGWYPNPVHSGNEQWWDGQIWRELTRPIPTKQAQHYAEAADPRRPAPKFMPKTRIFGRAVAVIQIVWMFTLGLIFVIMLIIVALDSASKTHEEQLTHYVIVVFTLCALSAPFLLLSGLGKRQSCILVLTAGLAGTNASGLALAFCAREEIAIRPVLPVVVLFAVAYMTPAVEAALTLRRQNLPISDEASYR